MAKAKAKLKAQPKPKAKAKVKASVARKPVKKPALKTAARTSARPVARTAAKKAAPKKAVKNSKPVKVQQKKKSSPPAKKVTKINAKITKKPENKTKSKPATKPVIKPITKTVSKNVTPAKAAKVQKRVKLPEGYRPTDKEEYMSPQQIEYFRQKLLAWKEELNSELNETLNNLKEENWQEPDITDRATVEIDTGLELRTRDRYRKLLNKIDDALFRIERGEYGYCEETGEEIGIKRLEARPIATLSVEAQERHERDERTHYDEDMEERM